MRALSVLIPVVLLVAGCNDGALTRGGASSDVPGGHDPDDGDHGDSDDTDPGVPGGHFDLDTSSAVYAFDDGTTDHHVHEYDDRFNVTSVDFFDLLDDGFTEIASRVGPTQPFYVIVGNAGLSPMTSLSINGTSTDVTTYQQKVLDFEAGAASLTTFTLAGGGTRLTSLVLEIDPDAILDGGLVATQTGCVRENDPGLYGEYRNGALLVQILDKATASIDPTTHVAAANGGLLWEATVFWHKPQAPCL